MLKVINNLTHRDEWVGLSLHDDSIKMRDALIETGTGTEGKIATLAPLYVTEANLHIYPEFSTGPFLYRSGDYLLADQLSYFRGTSPKRVDKLFSTDPPAAILVGFYSDLERPFLEYAEANNYSKADVAGLIGELYVRP